MIIRPRSRFIHAVPLPLPFRAFGLDASFTGRRGLAMWNPVDAPVTSVTLCHGQLDPSSARPSVRVVTEQGERINAALTAILALPGVSGENLAEIETTLRGRPDITLNIDGRPTPFTLYRHDSRRWVAFAALTDVEVAVHSHAVAVEDVALVGVDEELSEYEAAPPIVPRIGDLADARADLVLGWAEPVMVFHWAHRMLKAGADNPALQRIVAGDLRDEERVRRDHEEALDEMGAPHLDVTQARWQVARSWASAAVYGGLRVEEAARRIVSEVYEQLERPESLRPLAEAYAEVERRGMVTGNLHAELLAAARAFLATPLKVR